MVRTSSVVVVALVAAGAGFAVGRTTAPTSSTSKKEPIPAAMPSHDGVPPPASTSSSPPSAPASSPLKRTAFIEAMRSAERDAAKAEASLPTCVQQLRVVRQLVKDNEAARVEAEGTPIPARPAPSAARFASSAVTGALQSAFTSTKIPGSVDGVDCSEYPCIAFGRIHGTEGEMPKIEHAASMAAYEGDILTVLLWSATDEEAKEAAEEKHESGEGLEQSLYAIALYPRADQAQLGDNLERRIRSRTAEIWNGMSPGDETAAPRP